MDLLAPTQNTPVKENILMQSISSESSCYKGQDVGQSILSSVKTGTIQQ